MEKSVIVARGSELRSEIITNEREKILTKEILKHFDRLHSLPEEFDRELEIELLKNELKNLEKPKELHFESGIVTFSPSSASKCERELFFKAVGAEQDEMPFFPYQRRWVRNGSAVHKEVQKDLLLAEKRLEDPAFRVVRLHDGSPAWEENLKDVRQFEHNGVRFQLFGKMDGILEYRDGSRIGFEYKTKSTTISAVGNYKLKDAQDNHKQQAIAYSLLFGIDEFLIVYESLAKDGWTKGEQARADMRAFYYRPTETEKEDLLDKFARVAKKVENKELPVAEREKCLFCPFKTICSKYGD